MSFAGLSRTILPHLLPGRCDDEPLSFVRLSWTPLPFELTVKKRETMEITGGAPATVLVVDDDADCRQCVRELLEQSGFVVAEARNGQVALEQMVSIPDVAVIVLDLVMPVMNGQELVRTMNDDPRLSQLQVLILSGAISATPRGPPISGSFRKPCDPSKLIAAVKACIARAEPNGAS